MELKREQEIKIDRKTYYIIETLEYEKEEYIYVQEIINDELVDKYMIYKYNKEQNTMMPITEKTKTEILLKLFIESITKDLGEE